MAERGGYGCPFVAVPLFVIPGLIRNPPTRLQHADGCFRVAFEAKLTAVLRGLRLSRLKIRIRDFGRYRDHRGGDGYKVQTFGSRAGPCRQAPLRVQCHDIKLVHRIPWMP